MKEGDIMTNTMKPNRLIHEKSPYLLQHANNPVNWYPWGEEAFNKANKEDKPIFLSIGYSTCHWCHVMAHESFEDKEVADYLNKHFISIKVDKEERPDVDNVYMNVCQAMTGHGGWPLTIVMFPNQKPFFSGTYFPKHSRNYMPGLMDILKQIHLQWEKNRDELENSSDVITNAIKSEERRGYGDGKATRELVNKSVENFTRTFDKKYGGFNKAPKFPTPHNLMFLIRAAYYEKNDKTIEMVEKTLDCMYQGGMFDHIGYGFSRYSTDNKWLVPHFEKMLYDNALLVLSYLEAYQVTKKNRYKNIADMTLEYVLRELTDYQGGFYCAQDADSEGVEGKYYVFTPEEIIEVLGAYDGKYFNEYYGITAKGNFEGNSIPNRLHINLEDLQIDNDLENDRITPLRKRVFEYRLHRTTLHKDDKILTSWNGIMIAAFARAYQVLKTEDYLQAAIRAEQFIQDKLCDDKKLAVYFRDGKSVGLGHIDDYAFYVWALIELYQVTMDVKYLNRAVAFNEYMIEQFFDRNKGGFYLFSEEGEQLIHRPKEIYDGAIPSGNSVGTYCLLKLASITGDTKLNDIIKKQISFTLSEISRYPSAFSFSMIALMLDIYPSKELVCVSEHSSKVKEMGDILSKYFLPDLTVIMKTNDNSKELEQLIPFVTDYKENEKGTAYYLCQNHACMAPMYDIKILEEKLIQG